MGAIVPDVDAFAIRTGLCPTPGKAGSPGRRL